MGQSDLDFIRTFNEKVGVLSRSNFAEWAHERYPKYDNNSWIKVFEEMRLNVRKGLYFPDDEAIEAYLLTFRILTQDNDCSIKDLAAIYEKLPDNNKVKQRFSTLREDLNRYLDSDSAIHEGGVNWTKREIMNHMIYGKYAHVYYNKNKKEVVDRWMSSNIHLEFLVKNQFVSALAVMYIAFLEFRALNLDLIGSRDII